MFEARNPTSPIVKIGELPRVDELLQRVDAAKQFWLPHAGFSTVGPSSYLMNPIQYMDAVSRMRDGMVSIFGPWYDEIARMVSERAQVPVYSHPNAGAPGFHVFTKTAMTPDKHVDTNFQKVFWPEPFTEVFSLTVLLESPKAGAGLDFFNPDSHAEYTVGDVVVHTGLVEHQISTRYPIEDGERRVTLQAHGARVLFSNAIVLYF